MGESSISANHYHAFYYFNGTMRDLGALGGKGDSQANAINNAGQAVGGSHVPKAYFQHAVIFWQEQIFDLGTLGNPKSGISEATDINDNYDSNGIGQIVGYSIVDTNYAGPEAFFYWNGTMTNIGVFICPYPDYKSSYAKAINNVGQIVGYCVLNTNGFNYVGFLYDVNSGNYSHIGGQGESYVLDVNDSGQIIEMDNTTNPFHQDPVLFINGTEYNLFNLLLNNPGITSLAPYAINNEGQIVASTNKGVVLLTPTDEDSSGEY